MRTETESAITAVREQTAAVIMTETETGSATAADSGQATQGITARAITAEAAVWIRTETGSATTAARA